jgi:hypothetical protein
VGSIGQAICETVAIVQVIPLFPLLTGFAVRGWLRNHNIFSGSRLRRRVEEIPISVAIQSPGPPAGALLFHPPSAAFAVDRSSSEDRSRLPGTEFFVTNPLLLTECFLSTGCGDDPFEDLFSNLLHCIAIQYGAGIQIHVV